MSDAPTRMSIRVAELRSTFDRGFAEPVDIGAAVKLDLLAVRIGTEACAIRVGEIAGLFVDKKIVRVPGTVATLLGIAGFRGAILPVFDLQGLLGQAAPATPRWLAIVAGAPVALAFNAFEGQIQVSPDAILPLEARTPMRSYAREFVRTPDLIYPLIHLPSILGAITALRPDAPAREER